MIKILLSVALDVILAFCLSAKNWRWKFFRYLVGFSASIFYTCGEASRSISLFSPSPSQPEEPTGERNRELIPLFLPDFDKMRAASFIFVFTLALAASSAKTFSVIHNQSWVIKFMLVLFDLITKAPCTIGCDALS